jgi:hypothetical protein
MRTYRNLRSRLVQSVIIEIITLAVNVEFDRNLSIICELLDLGLAVLFPVLMS